MALPNTFANETTPQMQELDENFQAVGEMGNFSCSATGTNDLVLTILADQPDITAYDVFMTFTFRIRHNNTGAATALVGSLAQLPIYKDTSAGPAALDADDLVADNNATLRYDASLNSGNGGFHMTSASATGLQRSGAVTVGHLAVWVDNNKLQDGGAIPAAPQLHCDRVSATGNYIVPAGVTTSTVFKISACGGGAGGGGVNATAGASAGGGGAGGVCIGTFSGFVAGQTVAVVIGAGGNGGANTGADGSVGGATTITPPGGSAIVTANGGVGGVGTTSAAAAVRGSAAGSCTLSTSGTVTLITTMSTIFGGSQGGDSVVAYSTNGWPGRGGNTPWGQGGISGGDGTGFGSGGAGAGTSGSATAGGAGKPGVVFFEYVR